MSGCERSIPPVAVEDSLQKEVSGANAFAQVEALVGFGPRPAGSEALEQTRLHIEAELAELGWSVERQAFEARTPQGMIEFVNLRARFGGADDTPVGLLCSHFDTKFYTGFEFVGANDAGSSTGLLIELARVLAIQPELARGIELVFFDGEEAFGTNITATDGLYGSKHYAAEWAKLAPKQRPQWGVLLDMVGDQDLKIRAGVKIPGESLREMADAEDSGYKVDMQVVNADLQEIAQDLLAAATDLDLRSYVGISGSYIIDDHIPLNVAAGIPTIDLIDFDFPYWHTPGDTLDKIDPESLEITGRVTMWLIEQYLMR